MKARVEEKTANEKTTTELIFSFHAEKSQEQFELDKKNNSNILHDHSTVQPAIFFPATTKNPKSFFLGPFPVFD